MTFATSERVTLGIEWELALVDPETRDLVGRASELLDRLSRPEFTGEFLTNTVEFATGVHHRVPEAVAQMRELRDELLTQADELGIGIIGSGTHPFANWQLQTVAPDARYLRVIDRSRAWGRQLAIWGVHAHIGLPDPALVAPVIRAVLANVSHLLALSASSPFWEGEDTGFSSHRSMLFRQLPTGGLPPDLEDYADYERIVAGMLRGEVILDERELRWDVRPAPRFGTVEIRIADGAPTLAELGAIAALCQCIVEETLRDIDRGVEPRALPRWAVRENKFRAARYGFDTPVLINAEGETEGARAAFARRIDELVPIARDLGCEGELVSGLSLAEHNSADRQRAAARTGGLISVVDSLRAELRG